VFHSEIDLDCDGSVALEDSPDIDEFVAEVDEDATFVLRRGKRGREGERCLRKEAEFGVLTSAGPTRPESRDSLSFRTVWISISKRFPSLQEIR
jgi:hypothetical protein